MSFCLVNILLTQALKTEGTSLGTVMTAAVESKDPSMVKEVGLCVNRNILDKQEVIQNFSRVSNLCMLS